MVTDAMVRAIRATADMADCMSHSLGEHCVLTGADSELSYFPFVQLTVDLLLLKVMNYLSLM